MKLKQEKDVFRCYVSVWRMDAWPGRLLSPINLKNAVEPLISRMTIDAMSVASLPDAGKLELAATRRSCVSP